MKRTIQAGKCKAQCLKINVPIAKLIPLEEDISPLFGKMKGTAHIKGDLIQSIREEWNACL